MPENMRSTVHVVQPVQIVHPVQHIETVQPVIVRVPEAVKPELPMIHVELPPEQSEVEVKPEEKPAESAQSEDYSSIQKKKPPKSEEKTSDEAETGSKKRKVRYEGEGGRIHTESQIDEILDFYLMTGELPIYVSDRQRYDYRHHERLPERKELLEQRGVSIIIDVSGSTRRAKNIIPLQDAKAQHQKRKSL